MRQWPVVIFLLAIFFISGSAWAADQKFFEFAPDYFASRGFSLLEGGEIFQLFLPQNDFLGGLDLWFDNAGQAGSVNFSLFDAADQLIFNQTITLGGIDPVAGGERVHLNFPQMAVNSGELYTLKISSALPQGQIYYADRIKFLLHNASFVSQYLNGAAKIDGEEKEFSFKFALYEDAEIKAPVISNLDIDFPLANQTRLRFNANEAVDFRVTITNQSTGFQSSTNFTGEFRLCLANLEACQLTLSTGLGQSYLYRLTVKDSWGNEKVVEGEFATPSAPVFSSPAPTILPTETTAPPSLAADSFPPVISGLRITQLTPRAVEVAWTTDEPADSSLLVSFTTEKLTMAAASEATLELEHLLSSGEKLEPKTQYYLTVTSRDFYNNVSSASLSFVTEPLISAPSPSPSAPSPFLPISSDRPAETAFSSTAEIQPEYDAEQGSGSAIIRWKPLTPEESEGLEGYRVDIFDENFQWRQSFNLPPEQKELKVENLPVGKYQVVIYAKQNGKFKKIASPLVLTIGPRGFGDRLFALWPWLAGPLVVLLIWIYKKAHLWEEKRKKAKTTLSIRE